MFCFSLLALGCQACTDNQRQKRSKKRNPSGSTETSTVAHASGASGEIEMACLKVASTYYCGSYKFTYYIIVVCYIKLHETGMQIMCFDKLLSYNKITEVFRDFGYS